MVGAEYDTHHGLTNAIVLPVVPRLNLAGMDKKVRRMSEAMHYKDHSVEAFISNIDELLDKINIPKSLNEIGVPEESAKRISEKAMLDSSYATNPKRSSYDEVLRSSLLLYQRQDKCLKIYLSKRLFHIYSQRK